VRGHRTLPQRPETLTTGQDTSRPTALDLSVPTGPWWSVRAASPGRGVASGAATAAGRRLSADGQVAAAPSIQAAAFDWLTRLRPAVWLEAAGFRALSTDIARRRVTCPATANDVVAVLADHGAALREARDVAWQPLRRRIFARNAESSELWSQVVDATRSAAAGAAALRLAEAAEAASQLEAGSDMHLVHVEPLLLWQRVVRAARTELPWPWPALVDTITHAAHVVAWGGVDQLDRDQPGLLDPADPELGWGHAHDAASATTAEVTARLDRLTAVAGAGWLAMGSGQG